MNFRALLICICLANSAISPAYAEGTASFTPDNARRAAAASLAAAGLSRDEVSQARAASHRGNILIALSSAGTSDPEKFFTCHYHGQEMACHPLPPWVSAPADAVFEAVDLLASFASDPESNGWSTSAIIGAGAAGAAFTVYTAGIIRAAWERYHAPAPATETPAAEPTPEDAQRARQDLDRALNDLFRAAEEIGRGARPTPPTERPFHFRAPDFDLRIDAARITGLLTRYAQANAAVATAVAACGTNACGHNHGGIFSRASAPPTPAAPRPTARPSRFQASVVSEPAAAPTDYLLEAAMLEEPSIGVRARLLQWLKTAAMTPAELLWRTAPNATLDFLVEPGPQTTRGIGFAARILAERGILPGSILLAGLPAWLLVFETFLDPFHVWCSLSVPIYLTGANSILFMGGTVWDGLRFRSGEVSLGERAAFMRDAILLRRAVSRARKNIVLPALARGLERGLSQNHYLRTQHGRIAGLPPWIHAFASGSQWADFASPQDIVSGPRSQNGVFGLDGALVFGENIRGNEERAFLWREMIAGVAQTRDWVALRLTGLADSNEISRNDFILAQWRLGKIAAILNQIEILGLLQIAERERGESRVPDLLGRAFNLLRQINLAIGNSTELVATREQIQNEIRALRHEIREEIRANACEKKIIGN